MDVERTRITITGERDEDGYFGGYEIGTQYVMRDGDDWGVVVRLNISRDEAVLCGGKHGAAFVKNVAWWLREHEGVQKVLRAG
jgi:hypothetical protein